MDTQMKYSENGNLSSYIGAVKHIVGDKVSYISFTSVTANSFTMATAFFEQQALRNSSCGTIIEIIVEKLDNDFRTLNSK